jgi:hypothetical protein
VFTGLSIFAFIVTSQFAKLPRMFKAWLPYMLGGMVLLVAIELNEVVNCKRMMDAHAFPYHAAVEVVGLGLFGALAVLFLDWDAMR